MKNYLRLCWTLASLVLFVAPCPAADWNIQLPEGASGYSFGGGSIPGLVSVASSTL